jgi:hypothetical protein
VGVVGDKGDKGDKGEKGEKGDQGIQGVAGTPGAPGAPGTNGKDAPQGKLLWATYGPTNELGRHHDVTAQFSKDLMQPSYPGFGRTVVANGYYTKPSVDRMYDQVGDVAYGAPKSVFIGYTDSSGAYQESHLDDSFGTIPGSFIKNLRASIGLVDDAPAQTAFQQQTAANAAAQAAGPTK